MTAPAADDSETAMSTAYRVIMLLSPVLGVPSGLMVSDVNTSPSSNTTLTLCSPSDSVSRYSLLREAFKLPASAVYAEGSISLPSTSIPVKWLNVVSSSLLLLITIRKSSPEPLVHLPSAPSEMV